MKPLHTCCWVLALACSAVTPLYAQTPTLATPDASAPSQGAGVAPTARIGTFKTLDGQAWRTPAGAAEQPVHSGDAAQVGDAVRTGVVSYLTLVLKDGSVLTLGPQSSLSLSQARFEPTTHEGALSLNLATGMLRMISGWLVKAQPDRVEVKTPHSVLGLRGTDFIVEVQP